MPQRQRKSAFLITMAIVCWVIGALGLVCGLCGTGVTAILMGGGSGPMGDYLKYMDAQAPAWRAFMFAKTIGQLLLSFVIIAAGVGLFLRQKWGRWTAVAYALLVIPLHLAHVSYDLAVVIPASERFVKSGKMGAATPPPGQQAGSTFGTVVSAVFWSGTGMAILIAMLMPAAGAALRPPKKRRRPRDEELDDFDDLDDRDDGDRDND